MLLRFAHGPETIKLGDLEVRRLGFGAMRLPGKEVWGEPKDPATAHAVLRRAIELGINFIDTAWYYGPLVANRLIVEALHPYPSDLVIATKLGGKRLPDKRWVGAMTPEELRKGVDTDLETLKLEQLPVVHLRWIGEGAPISFTEALDVLIEQQRIGKIRHLALSNVTVEQLEQAVAKTPIVAVQNMYNLAGGSGPGHIAADPEAVLAACEQKGIGFLPFFPLAIGALAGGDSTLQTVATRLGCTPAQLAIAWLLARSKVMLPIPGTSKIAHLEENAGAVHVALDEQAIRELTPHSTQQAAAAH
ncbi:MAG TPA: aldo/keto reductase [Kofleriaceae bacterium]|nr:aldo/keto reductase [Kofleriaceae bacterium]